MPQSPTDWIAIVSTAIAILTGGGGLVAYLRYRMDRKRGTTDDIRGDSDSLNARAVAITTIQFEYLIQPLKEKVDGLEKELKEVRSTLKERDDQYRHAIKYIRVLLAWISEHFPDRTDLPPTPPDLAGDIN